MRKVHRMRGSADSINGLKDLVKLSLKEKNDVIGIEIGSYAGESSDVLMTTGKFSKLFCIDPWESYNPKELASFANDLAEQKFDLVLKKHPKIEKIKALSQNVSSQFENESIDFLYIDGEHTFQAVIRDLENYFQKVKIGGIVAGHDWDKKDVCEAVDTFFKRKPEYTLKDNSWYFIKDESMQGAEPIPIKIKPRDRVLIVGSGPTVKEDLKKIDLTRFTVLGINNTWMIGSMDFLIYPCDYKPVAGFLASKCIKISNYEEYCETFGFRVSQRGDSMLFNALYYSVVNWNPKEIYCVGCDMDYSSEKTHFYGKGQPDPLRLSRLNYFLKRTEKVIKGTKLYAVTSNEKTKLPFEKIIPENVNEKFK